MEYLFDLTNISSFGIEVFKFVNMYHPTWLTSPVWARGTKDNCIVILRRSYMHASSLPWLSLCHKSGVATADTHHTGRPLVAGAHHCHMRPHAMHACVSGSAILDKI